MGSIPPWALVTANGVTSGHKLERSMPPELSWVHPPSNGGTEVVKEVLGDLKKLPPPFAKGKIKFSFILKT